MLVDALHGGAALPLQLVTPHNLLWTVEQPQLLIDALPDAFQNPGPMAAHLFFMGVVGELRVVR